MIGNEIYSTKVRCFINGIQTMSVNDLMVMFFDGLKLIKATTFDHGINLSASEESVT